MTHKIHLVFTIITINILDDLLPSLDIDKIIINTLISTSLLTFEILYFM